MTRDAGLQPERTRLAWTRTGIAMGANALLLFRLSLVEGRPSLLACAAVASGLSAAFVLFGLHRSRQLALSPKPARRGLLLLTAGASLFAAASAAGGILAPTLP